MNIVGLFHLVVIVGWFLLASILWPYTINTWLELADKAPVVCWYHGFLLGLIPGIGQLCVPLAVITWIFTLFI